MLGDISYDKAALKSEGTVVNEVFTSLDTKYHGISEHHYFLVSPSYVVRLGIVENCQSNILPKKARRCHSSHTEKNNEFIIKCDDCTCTSPSIFFLH